MTANDTFDLDLSSFKLGFEDYRKHIINIYRSLDDPSRYSITSYIPKQLREYVKYKNISSFIINSVYVTQSGVFQFLNSNFFETKELLLGFLQLLIDEFHNSNTSVAKLLNNGVLEPLTSNIFNLDLYFDESDNKLKRKIDPITTSNINEVSQGLDEQNKDLYEQCVSEFLTFSLPDTSLNDYYHESLDRMKEIIENHLTINYDDVRISNKNRLSDIIFNGQNEEFKSILEFVVKKIHHNDTGNRIQLNQKEYIYIWLELNKILYLLKRYKS